MVKPNSRAGLQSREQWLQQCPACLQSTSASHNYSLLWISAAASSTENQSRRCTRVSVVNCMINDVIHGVTATSLCLPLSQPPWWRYAALRKCNVVNLHNCCVWNYTRMSRSANNAGMRICRCPHCMTVIVQIKYTSNMAAWFYLHSSLTSLWPMYTDCRKKYISSFTVHVTFW